VQTVADIGEILLGGRRFQFVNFEAITSLNEHYVMKLMRETGLDRVAAPQPHEEADAARQALEKLEAAWKQDAHLVTDEERDRRAAQAAGYTAQIQGAAALYMARLQAEVVDTLRAHELLAGYLLPAGKTEADWNMKMAEATAKFLQGLSKPADKATVHDLTLRVVLSFFVAGLSLFDGFLRSSRTGQSPVAEAPSPNAVS
jgi:hypothetical protein